MSSKDDSATDIAIIGMHGRFPGSTDLEEFWAQLHSGTESIRPFTDDELAAAGVTDALRSHPLFVNAGAVLDEPDCFDAQFFGFSRREAETMDPQHRVLLECAWAALEHAGYDPTAYPGVVGVFGGVAQNSYYQSNLATHPDLLETLGRYATIIGSEREFAVTRIAYKLNLTGPSISVNTACSTSGVALHLACQSLLAGECDAAVVGGARIRVPLTSGYLYQEDGILSPDGHCRAFDAEGRGTVIGSGGAMIVVKRLEDARRDRDTVHAVVKGTAVNNDGSAKIGFTAPGVRGQQAVIREALDVAEIDASTIGYVEAHGTGTFIGDPIEVEALTRAYREDTDAVGYCRIGSLKTNIGHLDAGAGVAGVIKAVLALQNGQIPPSLHFTAPNPQIDFAASPFQVSDRLSDWPEELSPRRAAVSSFGLGGTNAHVVLEQAPLTAVSPPSGRDHHLFVVSARTEASIEAGTRALAGYLERHPELEPADIAHTLAVGRRHHPLRRAVVGRDSRAAAQALTAATGRSVRQIIGDRPVVFMFPGGGVQHVGMGRRLYATEPEFRRWFDHCARLNERPLGRDLRRLLYDDADVVDLERPAYALPALFATEYAAARLLQSLGIRPDLMIGHSLGEYTAACLAGVMSLEDAVALVALRGALFETLPPGAMLSVPLAPSQLEHDLGDDLSIAVVNKPDLCIVAGGQDAVDDLERRLSGQGVETRRLRIGVAAHSHLVEPILGRFGDFASTIELSEPHTPYISNLTGEVVASDQVRTPEYWVAHLRGTVRFVDGLATVLAGEPKVLVEVGPGQVLSGLARQHAARVDGQVVVATLPHPSEAIPDDAFFLGAVGKLWAAGVQVDLAALQSGEQRRRVPLPTYPFDRVRHWIEPGTAVQAPAASPTDGQPVRVDVVESPEPAAAVPADRRERIRTRVVGIFSDLSGLGPDEMDTAATFLELGFDSLFMTQATSALGSAFKTRVSFRQLFEEAPTLDALSSWLDARLPEDAVPAPAVHAPPPQVLPSGSLTGLDQIAAQLAQLQRQIAALSGAEPLTDAAVEVGALSGAEPPVDLGAGAEVAEPTGPWRPPERRSDDLEPDQRRSLDGLTERLTSRSPGSKAATEANRGHLADPRTVAGFRRAWKEIVYPVVAERSAGSKLWDVDGNEYLDVAMGFGVNLFGHSPRFVVEAVTAQLARGIEIGPQTPLAGETAGLIAHMTGHERVAFCNTGSEAVLAAMRLARTVTRRSKIVTFAVDYHGLFDEVLARGVSRGGKRRSIPIAPGIPEHAPQDLVIFDYGDPEALVYVAEHASEVAAVLVEPVQSRNPDFQPVEFLRELRRVTTEARVALVFDEMITGFRSHPGGAQALFGVKADLATYGKVIGGGFPIGVVAGDAAYMDALDGGAWHYGDDSIPEADVTWFAGTFVRHPIALAASRAALVHMGQSGTALQAGLNDRTTRFVAGLNDWLQDREVPLRIEHFSSLFLTRFQRDQQFSSLFYFHLRDQGIHITEGRPAFLSTAHSDADIERLDAAYRAAVTAMAEARFLSTGTDDLRSSRLPTARELPLTDGQQEIWLAASQSDDANCAYNLANTLHVTGPLDVDALRRSLGRLVARHDALRVTFTADGTHQRVAPRLELDLPVVDLSNLDERARASSLADQRVAEVETPFDLSTGPLVRVRLVRMSAEDHHLFLTVHHAVCDGWSSGTLLRNLADIYSAERRGRPLDLPPTMQSSEYAEWFERYRASEDHAADESFWTGHVGDDFPVTDLLGDRPRPSRRSYQAERRVRRLDHDLVGNLRRLAKAEGCTLFTLLLGSFECLLARLTGRTEVGLAVVIAGHTRFPGRDLVAHCANALPLRRPVAGDASFSHHLKTTQAAFLDAFDHQDFSYGAIVRSLRVRRDPSKAPLVSVIFNMDSPAQPLEMDTAVAIPGSNARHFENFDLFVNVVPRGDELEIECTYNLAVFDAATIDRRLEEWVTVLSGAVASGGGVLVGDLGVVPAGELALLEQWNSTAVGLGREETLVSLFGRAVARTPDAVAVEFGGRGVTYAELMGLAHRVAARLVKLGVAPGSMVGVLCEPSVELVAALYGVVMAGAAYVPLDPESPTGRIGHMVGETGMKVVLYQDRFRELVADPAVVRVDVDDLLDGGERASVRVALPEVAPDDVAYVIYTSGSTGRPKGVANAHRGVVNQASWMQDRFGLGPGDVVLQKTPFTFDLSVSEFFWPLQVGARLVVTEPGSHRDPAYLVETIVEHRVDTVHFVPTMLRLFLDHPAAGSCTSLRRVICIGEALTRDLQDRFFAVLPGAELHNLYGPTEAAVQVTAWQCRPDDPRPVVPIGAPMANTTIHILDDRMRPVPIGVPGELYIGGVQVAVGYVGRDDLTGERFVPDPFDPPGRLYKTGDLARWLPDGQVDFLGRLDHQVKIRGQRVELGEIEATLGEHPSVLEAAVTLWKDAAGDAALLAYLAPRAGKRVELAEIQAHLKRLLPAHMIPASYVLLDEPPLTTSGKLDRNALPAPDRIDPRDTGEHVAPRTDLERDIARMWADVLGVDDSVGAETDFFDLGGHSLKLMQLASRIDQVYGVRPALVSLLEAPTVAGQAVLVTEALIAGDAASDEILAELLADLAAGADSGAET